MLDIVSENTGIAKILVVGVGGAGNNAVDRMIGEGVEGVEFVSLNTDMQALNKSKASTKLQLGEKTTKGLGAGGRPQVGKDSAIESQDEIAKIVEGADMVFVTAGMGGGTGTGAAPIVAEVAKKAGILTIGVVTKPFDFEGKRRMDNALEGINAMKENVDSLVVIPNEKLLSTVEELTSFSDALLMADEVLRQGITGISDLITKPGMINLDFNDIRSVMQGKGMAHMGVGRGAGKSKVEAAVNTAINSPLLETKIDGAKTVLINVTGNLSLGLLETNAALQQIKAELDEDANIYFGTSINDDLNDEVIVTIIATDLKDESSLSERFKKTADAVVSEESNNFANANPLPKLDISFLNGFSDRK